VSAGARGLDARRKLRNDPRATKSGSLLRVSSIDELLPPISTIELQVESLTQQMPSD
jgi:lipopolysaccharide/colanic/teichoic acid biosynthesis glycosyltransferase